MTQLAHRSKHQRFAPAPVPPPAAVVRRVPVTLIEGDGVGLEVAAAVRRVLEAAGAPVVWEEAPGHEAGLTTGTAAGLPQETVDAIERTGVLLKGPLARAPGFRVPRTTVTFRRAFETFATVRPARELPGVHTAFSGRGVDLVIVSEHAEDLYVGAEHMQTPSVAQALRLVSRAGCERVARLAFEVAEDEARRSLTCATGADALVLTDGLMQRAFGEVAAEYPRVTAAHRAVDEVAHDLVRRPEDFDVILTSGVGGDILGDLAMGLVGGRNVAASASVGHRVAIFEPAHGPGRDVAGRDLANPTAMLRAAVMLLRHIGAIEVAGRIEWALEETLRRGVRTRDLGGGPLCVGTSAFADDVIARLEQPHREGAHATTAVGERHLRAARLHPVPESVPRSDARAHARETTVGMDVFVQSDWTPAQLGPALSGMTAGTRLCLRTIWSRGAQVHPGADGRPSLADHYCCRFVARGCDGLEDRDLFTVLERIALAFRWVHVERLREFDGIPGYTHA